MLICSFLGFEIPDVDAEKLQRPADVVQYIVGRETVQI
jgi:acyl carrier protein